MLRIAKDMCDAGAALAVMGNHEFNALAWAASDGNGGFLRPHTEKNANQHKEFLSQIGEGSPAHRQALDWFESLPSVARPPRTARGPRLLERRCTSHARSLPRPRL